VFVDQHEAKIYIMRFSTTCAMDVLCSVDQMRAQIRPKFS
jgi:hypothetical protein